MYLHICSLVLQQHANGWGPAGDLARFVVEQTQELGHPTGGAGRMDVQYHCLPGNDGPHTVHNEHSRLHTHTHTPLENGLSAAALRRDGFSALPGAKCCFSTRRMRSPLDNRPPLPELQQDLVTSKSVCVVTYFQTVYCIGESIPVCKLQCGQGTQDDTESSLGPGQKPPPQTAQYQQSRRQQPPSGSAPIPASP